MYLRRSYNNINVSSRTVFLFSYLEATVDSEDDEAALLFALECSILFKADKYARAEETTISVSAPVAVNVLVPLVSVWLFVMVSAVDSSVGLIVTRVVANDSMP